MVEHLKHSVLPRVLADVVGDIADLVQKEMRLARTELSEKLASKLRAGLWMGIAGGFGRVAFLLVIEGIVFGIATLGIAMHWSCLIVAAGLAAAAAVFYAKGAAQAREELTPSRTIHQVKQDIATAKEQLT